MKHSPHMSIENFHCVVLTVSGFAPKVCFALKVPFLLLKSKFTGETLSTIFTALP